MRELARYLMDRQLTNYEIVVAICSVLIFILLLRTVYILWRGHRSDFRNSTYRVLVFACVSLSITVVFVTKFFPAHKIEDVKKLVSPFKKSYPFNSDTLDKYFLDLPKHDSILELGLKNIDRNDALAYINYYNDKINVSSDQTYIDVSNWALGIVYFNILEYESNAYFKKVKNNKIYKYNYYQALLCLSKKDVLNSENFLKREYDSQKIHDKKLVNLYFNVLLQNKNMKQARIVYQNHHLLIEDASKNTFFINDLDYINYFKIQARSFFANLQFINFLIALFITFTWFYFLYFSDLFQKEKFRYFAFIFLVESCLVFLCPFLYKYIEFNWGWALSSISTVSGKLLYAIGCISLIEETVKALPFLILLVLFKEPDDSYDYLFYMCMSALTFSFIENCIYFNSIHNFGVYNGRALFSTIAHLYSSSMIGYGFMYAKYHKSARFRWLYIIVFFIGGVLFHGLYDFFLFTNITILFYLGYFMSIVVWVVLLNNSLNNSQYFSYKFENRHQSIQFVIGINLVVVMLIEYVLNALGNGYAPANIRLLNQIMIYGVVISFFVSRLAKYDLVKGYWRSITFSSYQSDRYYFHKFNVVAYIGNFFLFNRINPRNYVDYKILFTDPKEHYHKTSIYRHIDQELHGEIVDRMVMMKPVFGNPKKSLGDPQWFVAKLSKPIDWAFNSEYIVFKFINSFDEISKEHAKQVIVYSPKSVDNLQSPEHKIEDYEFIGVAGVLWC